MRVVIAAGPMRPRVLRAIGSFWRGASTFGIAVPTDAPAPKNAEEECVELPTRLSSGSGTS